MPRTNPPWFVFPSVIAAVILIACLLAVALPYPKSDWHEKYEEHFQNLSPTSNTTLSVEKRFEYRLSRYSDDLASFYGNIYIQAILSLVSFGLLTRRSETQTVPIVDIELSTHWFYILIPATLLFFWLQFGYLLDQLIENRSALWLMTTTFTDTQKGTLSDKVWNFQNLLFDAGLIDGWFALFHYRYSGIRESLTFANYFFPPLIFGLLVGCSHAAVLSVLAVGARRFATTNISKILYTVLIVFASGILISSHIQFAYGGNNPNWLVFFAAAFTVAFTFLFCQIANRFDATETQDKVLESELRDRLMHVSVIGDSLTTNFFVSSPLAMIWRIRTGCDQSWFLDRTLSQERGPSFCHKLEKHLPIVPSQYAMPMSCVDSGGPPSFADRLIGIRHFSDQVNDILEQRRFPNLLLIWIGHNNMDWVKEVDGDKVREPRSGLKGIAKKFGQDFSGPLDRLVGRAREVRHKTLIIVFGLVNFAAFFAAREDAEAQKKENQTLFPYLKRDYRYFESMKPEYRGHMIELSKLINCALEQLVADRQGTLRGCDDTRLIYSNAFAQANLNQADMLSPVDAWHSSPYGRAVLAEAAFDAVQDWLEFLRAEQSVP